MPVAWLLPKSFVEIGNRTNVLYLKVDNVVKVVKESLGKLKKKVAPSACPKTSGQQPNVVTQPENFVQRRFDLKLQNFQTTVKENAARALRQNNSLTKCSKKSYFRRDFIWRRARSRHLIAFGGLFLYQEETQESNLKLETQFKIYSNICENIKEYFPEYCDKKSMDENLGNSVQDFKFNLIQKTSSNSKEVVLNAQLQQNKGNSLDINEHTVWEDNILTETVNELKSDFSVKVLLNECPSSNYNNLLKRASGHLLCYRSDQFGRKMPPHPNIINLERAFIDNVLPELDMEFDKSYSLFDEMYSDKAMYLVSKRYLTTLTSYLKNHNEIDDITTCVLMLQLLEAVAHLEQHNITHRNINTDNIFIEADKDGFVQLVLGGFDFAFSGNSANDLKVPFAHQSLDTRVKELSVKAPEVAKAKPGIRNVIDYRKTDAWKTGVIGYEILTGRKLFGENSGLDVCSYATKDLPNLQSLVISNTLVRVLEMLVEVDPKKRITACEAANILHLDMFAMPPCGQLSDDVKCKQLQSWVVTHCAEAMARKEDHSVPYELCSSFYKRLNVKDFYEGFCIWMAIRCCK